MPSGYLYFVQSEKGGPVKVGITTRPHQRLEELKHQTGWSDLVYRLLMWVPDVMETEAAVHRRFRQETLSTNLGNEWFEGGETAGFLLMETAAISARYLWQSCVEPTTGYRRHKNIMRNRRKHADPPARLQLKFPRHSNK